MIRAVFIALALAGPALATAARAEIEVVPVTSPGGITAWLYEDDTIPIITIDAAFLGGASLDAKGREGTTYLMADLLDEGAGELDATAFAAARDDLATHLNVWADDDAVSLSATMLAETRDQTVDLLRLALTAPRFDPEAVERVRAQALASIRMGQGDPGTLAHRAFWAEAFPGHPYGRQTEGTLESVTSMSIEDLREARTAALTRNRLRVSVVGAIGPDETGTLLDQLFGGLPASGPDLPPIVEPTVSGGTTIIDLDAPQTLVVFGTAGLRRNDPDFIPAVVMDYILGGDAFGSRLTSEMREKRGLTYGVSTYLAVGSLSGLYMGSFSSSNARVAEALEILRREWERMAREGVNEAELMRAKRFLTGEYSLRFDGNGNIAAELLGQQIAGLEPDYVNRRNSLVEAVTEGDVTRVARRLLSDSLTTVLVGRPEGMAAGN